MELDFDKEMDVLLRQTAQGETVFEAENPKSKIQNPKFAHLDADEISAFAENALPEKSRQRYVAHFADCAKCRKNLSNLITLNGEPESETVRAEEKQIAPIPIPWYRKLFVFPNLAYTMGALILVFSGIAVFTVLQSVNNSQSLEISQTSEKQSNGKGMSSDGDEMPTESYSSNMMSNSASMNSSSNTATNFSNPAMPSATVSAMNSNAAMTREDSDKNVRAETKSLVPQKEPTDAAKTQDLITAGAPPPPVKENDYQADGEVRKQQQNQAQNSIAQNQTTIAPDSRNVQRAPSAMLRADNKAKKLEESKDDAREKSIETTTVAGGKIFKRQNNVWYDSTYRGQATTNITRGTKEYKKLDSGLRGIAENLGGTIVVVWKQKAYRIQ